MERRGKICLFVLCLPLAFGLFSILPASKSFKQFKRYMLTKNLRHKTTTKLSKRGKKPVVKDEERERRKTKEREREKIKKGAFQKVKKRIVLKAKRGQRTVKRVL